MKMFSFIFQSQFLKFKNNKVYLFNKYDIKNVNYDNYENESYYIDYSEIEKTKKIELFNNINIEYSISINENNEIYIKIMNINNSIDNMNVSELQKISYLTENNILGYHDIDNIDNMLL
jgi:hypothetical protein